MEIGMRSCTARRLYNLSINMQLKGISVNKKRFCIPHLFPLLMFSNHITNDTDGGMDETLHLIRLLNNDHPFRLPWGQNGRQRPFLF
jgi:hypothetical protein